MEERGHGRPSVPVAARALALTARSLSVCTAPGTSPTSVSLNRHAGSQISRLLIVRGGPVWRSPAVVVAEMRLVHFSISELVSHKNCDETRDKLR
jgi:hypothetical protein